MLLFSSHQATEQVTGPGHMSPWQYWWVATRTPSVLKILFPICFGISVGFSTDAIFEWALVVFALVYGWLNQLTIIFLNDAADYAADIHHTKKYPGLIDPRVIPNQWLSKKQILAAGWVTTSLMTAVTVLAATFYDRPFAPVFAFLSVSFIWAYSFPPIKINYRGHGELVEMVGVGAILPWLGFYLCTGNIYFPLVTAIPLMFLALAGSIASTLKHTPADRETGKKTVPVKYGLSVAKQIILGALVVAIISSAILGAIDIFHPLAIFLTSLVPMVFVWQMTKVRRLADCENLKALKQFKTALNNATYVVITGMSAGFFLPTLL